jgi:outer membrane protein assembly factor BamA
VGEPVAQVSLEAAQGVLPADNLEPLLRTQAGDPLTVGTLRADVALLVSAGGFASVEATVEPWVIVDEWGMPEDAVKVVYRVIAAPKVESLRIRGVRGAARKVVESGFGVDLGDAWFGDDEAKQLTRTIQARLSQAGWTDATAEVSVEAVEDDIRLTVVVDAGEPQRVGTIRVAGNLPVAPAKIRKWLKKNGLKKGRRFDQAKGDLARLDVVDRLRAMGWSRSRVSLFVQDRTVSEALGISVLVSPGPRLIIDATGRKLPGEKHLREVMGLRAGDRYSDNALTDASSRLESWYGDRGYRGAAVDVRVHSSTSETTKVTVDARPGRKHWLRETNYPDEMPIPEREARAVVQEATDGSLAERIVSQKGIDRASKALKERFRSEGFLDAQVSIEEIKGRFSGVMSVTRWGVPVTLDVKVEPGSRVSLGSLRVRGGTGLADEVVAAWKVEYVDRPF